MFDFLANVIAVGEQRFRKFKILPPISYTIAVIFCVLALFTLGLEYFIIAVVGVALLACPVFFALGLVTYITSWPKRREIARYNETFETIKLQALNGAYPTFVKAQAKEYVTVLSFKSLVPLNEWQNKQALLATYLHKRIVSIKNDPHDNNVVDVTLVNKDLPTFLAWSDNLLMGSGELIAMGEGYQGLVTLDLNKNAHAFIAGETGSGKSNILKGMIYQCLKLEYEVKLIDFKQGVSFAAFDKTIKIYSEYEPIKTVLAGMVKETKRRLELLRSLHLEDITQYNRMTKGQKMKRLVMFIDELAELMRAGDKEESKSIISSLETLTRLSRAAGINLIMGIQRPDATIINGQIKSNVSLRICGRFVDPEPSRIMLGSDKANALPKIKGRFIYKDDDYQEFQAFCFSDGLGEHFPLNPLSEEKENALAEANETKPKSTSSLDDMFNFDDIE